MTWIPDFLFYLLNFLAMIVLLVAYSFESYTHFIDISFYYYYYYYYKFGFIKYAIVHYGMSGL